MTNCRLSASSLSSIVNGIDPLDTLFDVSNHCHHVLDADGPCPVLRAIAPRDEGPFLPRGARQAGFVLLLERLSVATAA